MEHLPLFFNLKNRDCLLIGGGVVAQRKAQLLQRAGAAIHIVAPSISMELQNIAVDSGGSALLKAAELSDLPGRVLVICASDDEGANAQMAQWAHEASIPVNVVDNAALSSVIFGAIVDRSPILIGISSGGNAPVLARYLRSRIETFIPSAFGNLASFIGGLRGKVKTALPEMQARNHFWQDVVEGAIGEKAMAGQADEAQHLLEQKLANTQFTLGEVALVGAGPGDPDLLTFKALRLLQAADVVLYDRLVNPVIVDMARRDAEKIYVGKARNQHAVPQENITQLLIEHAKLGKRVVRLKGGDPFIFGRGGEEIEGLAEEKIPFQVVPGITAASACASYSGIPLTHRDYAQSVRFVTGHLKDNSCNLSWHELVNPDQTVVFYMGLLGLPEICKQLIAHGRSELTPIALIQQGTSPEQQVFTGVLANFAEYIASQPVKAPTLIIVGEVVALHEKLHWFKPQGED